MAYTTVSNNYVSNNNDIRVATVTLAGEVYQKVVPVSSSGTLGVSTATLANVSSSATNVTLFAANSSRSGAMLFNDSTQYLYLKYGATATTSSFTERVAPYAHWYMTGAIYTGIIDGIWASANGAARTTEL